jgi:glycerol kinase
LLELFDVPRHALPAIVPSAGVVGETAPGLFPRPVPIAGMAGDQQAALFGQGGWESGRAKCTYGTGAFLLMEVGADLPFRPGEGGLLTTVACGPEGQPVYALEGSIFVAGAAVQWLRDGLGIITRAAETEALARSVADTGGVYFVPALVGLGAPHWEPKARGTIVGLTRGTNRAHLVRAALEAMAYGTREVVETMSRVARVPLEILRVDGGATANDWLMQFQADVLGVPVARPDLLETTSVGAAGLAGLAVGAWPDAESFLATRRYQTFVAQRPVHDGYREWRRAVEAALHWARFAAEGGEGPPVG